MFQSADKLVKSILVSISLRVHPDSIIRFARITALWGAVLPLLFIGLLKFTQVEVDALKPIINGTPWLSWLYTVFGENGASWFLGTVEIFTGMLLIFSPWSARAGLVGGFLGTITFATTVSILFAIPIWYSELGGFPWIDPNGQFLIKDIAMLGVCMVVFGESFKRYIGNPTTLA
ncbi:MAG: YkgB family protein [Paraglaciecola chathamensis]